MTVQWEEEVRDKRTVLGTWEKDGDEVQDEVPRRIRGPRTENMAPESDLMISAADY